MIEFSKAQKKVQNIKDDVYHFLKEKKFEIPHQNLNFFLEHFLNEMDLGLSASSSLAMIPSYLNIPQEKLPYDKSVIILDAGGSNLRSGLFHLDENGKPVIKYFRKRTMPGFDCEVSKKEFFSIIADMIEDLCEYSTRIGFCFSYPVEIMPNKDGKLLYFTKEIKASEVEKSLIGYELITELKRRNNNLELSVTMLNDTVATAMASYTQDNSESYDGVLGVILGTGANSCYLESKEKLPVSIKENMSDDFLFVNLEHGNYNGFPRSTIDLNFDKKTANPGQYQFEKMTSGAYIVPLVKEYFFEALEYGLFDGVSEAFLRNEFASFDLETFDNLMKKTLIDGRFSSIKNEIGYDNLEKLYYIASAILKRAARCVAVNIAALIIKSNRGWSPLKPMGITIDGSTFYGYRNFPYLVEKEVDRLLKGKYKRYYQFLTVDNAPMLGAGIAALTYL